MGLFGAIGKGLSRIGGLASRIAPAVGLIPGLGTIAGAGLGLGGALLSGEGLGTGLKRGLLGGLGAGGLSKIASLVGGAAGPGTAGNIARIGGEVLGGKTTGENIRKLLTEVGLPVARGIDRRLSRGRRERESDALDAFFRSIDRGETERISSARERFGLESGALN